jgi:hypothetical protein
MLDQKHNQLNEGRALQSDNKHNLITFYSITDKQHKQLTEKHIQLLS